MSTRLHRGMALAGSLVLLLLLSIVSLSTARLGALDLAAVAGEAWQLEARQAAQSSLDRALRSGCSHDCEGVTVSAAEDPLLPPPVNSGYSASKVAARVMTFRGGNQGIELAEGIAVLEAREPPPHDGGCTNPATPATAWLDSDADGAIDRGYAGDAEGNLWRLDPGENPGDWRRGHLATLPGAIVAAPDLVQREDDSGLFVEIAIGTGRIDGAGRGALFGFTDRGRARDAAAPDLAPDWSFALDAGDQLLGSPIHVAHSLYFSRWRPGARCEDGVSQVYRLNANHEEAEALGEPVEGAPFDLRYAGAGPACTVELAAGPERIRVSGCPRFRTWWLRADS